MGSGNNGSGTVRHERPSPASVIHQTVAEYQPSARALIRSQRLRDMLASIEEFWRASGPDRVWWRRDARHRLAEWRRLHQEPERAAFQQAVVRSKRRRCADCGTNWADLPSKLCPGCEAYREHTGDTP